MMAGEVDCPIAGVLISLAVTVAVPVAVNATLKAKLPPTSPALDGKLAVASLDVIATVSVALLTKFQFASTPFTVTLKGVPATCVAACRLCLWNSRARRFRPAPAVAVSPTSRHSQRLKDWCCWFWPRWYYLSPST